MITSQQAASCHQAEQAAGDRAKRDRGDVAWFSMCQVQAAHHHLRLQRARKHGREFVPLRDRIGDHLVEGLRGFRTVEGRAIAELGVERGGPAAVHARALRDLEGGDVELKTVDGTVTTVATRPEVSCRRPPS